MDDRVDFFFGKQSIQQRSVTYVTQDKLVMFVLGYFRKSRQVTGIGQLVEIDDAGVGASLLDKLDEIGPDETATTCNQDIFQN